MCAGLLLPILGALPDALIILVSGLGGTRAEAQEQVGSSCPSPSQLHPQGGLRTFLES